jgi:hypothetical protein
VPVIAQGILPALSLRNGSEIARVAKQIRRSKRYCSIACAAFSPCPIAAQTRNGLNSSFGRPDRQQPVLPIAHSVSPSKQRMPRIQQEVDEDQLLRDPGLNPRVGELTTYDTRLKCGTIRRC